MLFKTGQHAEKCLHHSTRTLPERFGTVFIGQGMNGMTQLASLHPSLAHFVGIRTTQGLYVDKTGYLARLLAPEHSFTVPDELPSYHFMARPRRFGKTLLIHTLEAWFQGHLPLIRPEPEAQVEKRPSSWLHQRFTTEELFQGLDILKVNSHPPFHPVIRLNMARVTGDTVFELQASLLQTMSKLYTEWYQRGIDTGAERYLGPSGVIDLPPVPGKSAANHLEALIERLAQYYGTTTVVLIDEYDAPITRMVGWEHARTRPLMDVLRSFFRTLKNAEAHLRYVFLTGITRFGHTHLFSALNNLQDISWDARFAALCGFTRAEVARYLGPHLAQIQREWPEGGTDLLDRVYDHYNGYRFAAPADTPTVCNPFTLTSCLHDLLARPETRPVHDMDWPHHWADSGTPELLHDLVRRQGVLHHDNDLDEFPPDPIYSLRSPDYKTLMLQSGYYTLRGTPDQLHLDYPNREVRRAYARSLLKACDLPATSRIQGQLATALRDGKTDDFLYDLTSCFYRMPYDHLQNESDCVLVMQALCLLLSDDSVAETHNWAGRCDLTVFLPHRIYVFELKYNGSLIHAERQRAQRNYGREYASRGLDVMAFQLNFVHDPDSGKPPHIEGSMHRLDFRRVDSQ